MSSFKTIRLNEIVAMLERCAPGSRIIPKKHRNWVYSGDKIYRGLPLGKHGRRRSPEIEIGHVRQLVNFLGIRDCAKKELSILGY